jgi:hypothetical protein
MTEIQSNALENCSRLLRLTKSPYWRLVASKDGSKRGDFEGESIDESINHLSEIIPMLAGDRYSLKYRKTEKGEKGQDIYEFSTVEPRTNQSTMQQPNYQQNSNSQGDFMLSLIRDLEALKMGFKYMEKDVDTLKSDVKKALEMLSDNDPTNDADAKGILEKVLENTPKIADGIKSMKDMWK